MSQPPPISTFAQAAAAPEVRPADTAFTQKHLWYALGPLGLMAASGVAGVVMGTATGKGESITVLATGFAMLVAAPAAVRASSTYMTLWLAIGCALLGMGNSADLIRGCSTNVLIASGSLTVLIIVALASPCAFRAPPMRRAILPTAILTPVLTILAADAGTSAESALALGAVAAATCQIAAYLSLVRTVGVFVTGIALAAIFLFASLLMLLSS